MFWKVAVAPPSVTPVV